CLGNYDRAAVLMEGALDLARKRARKTDMVGLLPGLGDIELRRGDYKRSATYLSEAVTLSDELGSRPFLVHILAHLVSLAGAVGRRGDAARLSGIVDAMNRGVVGFFSPPNRALSEQTLAIARETRGPES